MASKDNNRRRWSDEETNKLVELMFIHYNSFIHYVTEALTPKKTRKMVDERWKQITDSINSIRSKKVAVTPKQVEKKWSDFKSKCKLAVMDYNKELGKTGGGQNTVKQPSEIQYRVAELIGKAATDGVVNAESFDEFWKLPVPKVFRLNKTFCSSVRSRFL